MNEYENEMELIDLLNIIWKRKWLIIIPTFILVVVAAVISFLTPRKWEVATIFQPSKYIIQTESVIQTETGTHAYSEIFVVEPKQIVGQINQASYNNLIASELKINLSKFPNLRAENIRDTKLVRVSIIENDVGKAK